MFGVEIGQTANSFRDLIVWQQSVDLIVDVYKASSSFPKSEIYGITSQIRRSAVSVSSNISEASGKTSRKEYVYFLHMSKGSMREFETLIEVSKRIGYLDSETAGILDRGCVSVGKLLDRLIRSLEPERKR